ncbi:hypothetical protein ACLESD_29200 [Pyxidicoccus sp. 3LFB2]
MWLAVTLLVVLGQAAPANPYLEQARTRYEALRFAEAVELLELAEQVPSSTGAQRLDILELRARCELAEGRRAEAEATYERMLMLDPRAEPPSDLSPKILETFQAVKARLFPAGYVALKDLPAAEGLVRVEVVDPWRRVEAVVLRWRGRATRTGARCAPFPRQGAASSHLPETAWARCAPFPRRGAASSSFPETARVRCAGTWKRWARTGAG